MPKSYTLSARVLTHYRATKRDLPWRRTRDPYAVLVSEVMLQQTQAARVAPAFERFMDRFPTLSALAAAPLAAVLREWSGLGYNRRARDLHRIALLCSEGLPDTVAGLDALPGIGAYTAGAVACFAHGCRVPFADVNIKRVLGRVFFGRPGTDKEAIELDRDAMPRRHVDLWHHALMDLGATICTTRDPSCATCPLTSDCRYANGPTGTAAAAVRHRPTASRPKAFKDSDRRVRGAIVRLLTDGQERTMRALEKEVGDDRVHRLTKALETEGLVERAGSRYRLPR